MLHYTHTCALQVHLVLNVLINILLLVPIRPQWSTGLQLININKTQFTGVFQKLELDQLSRLHMILIKEPRIAKCYLTYLSEIFDSTSSSLSLSESLGTSHPGTEFTSMASFHVLLTFLLVADSANPHFSPFALRNKQTQKTPNKTNLFIYLHLQLPFAKIKHS